MSRAKPCSVANTLPGHRAAPPPPNSPPVACFHSNLTASQDSVRCSPAALLTAHFSYTLTGQAPLRSSGSAVFSWPPSSDHFSRTSTDSHWTLKACAFFILSTQICFSPSPLSWWKRCSSFYLKSILRVFSESHPFWTPYGPLILSTYQLLPFSPIFSFPACLNLCHHNLPISQHP